MDNDIQVVCHLGCIFLHVLYLVPGLNHREWRGEVSGREGLETLSKFSERRGDAPCDVSANLG